MPKTSFATWVRRGVVFCGILLVGGLVFANSLLMKSVKVISRTGDAPLLTKPALEPAATDWPCWRGANGTGISLDSHPPLTWTADTNVAWKVPVPGLGHSSPILWGEHLFLTTADQQAGTQSLLCLDRKDGSRRWLVDLHQGGLMTMHEKNSHASATPAADGACVYTVFPRAEAIWVSAVDFAGNIRWQTEAGPFKSTWGYGSSVALHDGLVIVSADNRGDNLDRLQVTSFLAALRADTGEIVWRIRRHNDHSFGTPIVGTVAGRPQLLLNGPEAIRSYDPATGKELWHCSSIAERTANTVAFAGDFVYAACAFSRNEVVCIRADGTGDVSADRAVWRSTRYGADVPSPLVKDDTLYLVNDRGLATCMEASSGKVHWHERLGSIGYSASPVWAAGHVYFTNEEGTTFVCKAGPSFEVVSKNPLAEPVLATPVFCDGRVYIRSRQNLWCIGAGTANTPAVR